VSAAPDVAGTVAGFRSWRVANGKLVSPYIPCRWEGRVIHAACFDANRVLQQGRGWLAAPHDSPHPDCQCGVYAYDRPGLRTYRGEDEVWWCEGVISAWGRLVVHSDGWRSEHARVEALAVPHDARLAEVLEGLARRLEVPLVERDELPAVAVSAGGLVPASLRPSPRSRRPA
jgi:hypothetical protein